ncbi:hypothetical protein P4H66_06300 [Paenibacillus dokdonensis]|uniref:Uncharacterized protein n=2 Tax=Paenibacillus dokdonensis TaxID=2567944 RepID=A0ABU6GIA6_9BACL|nr:hypothetical protein [Paenibacillus dokdonensis]MEC0239466.1 hypothetical protein [Paenibacillus dokdonensis]
MGTSIPRRENEVNVSGQGAIKTYTLTPEELAAIQPKPIPKSHSTPIGFRTKVKNTNPEEVRSDMAKIKKEDYLELRVKGSTRKEAAKKLGTSKQSLETYWFGKWGIKNDASEEVEIARYKELRTEKKQEVPGTQPTTEIKAETTTPSAPIEPEKPAPAQQQIEAIPTLPVQLTQEQADALRLVLQIKQPDEIVLHHSSTFIVTRERWRDELDPLNVLSMDEMIRALYFGFEAVKTPEELLIQEFENAEARFGAHSGVAFRTGLQIATDILGHKVVGINA